MSNQSESPAAKLPRRVEPELLDALAPDDPQAKRSRRDLRRVNLAMATLSVALGALDRAASPFHPRSILELGAGDGTLMLRVARRRAARWPSVNVKLLDRQDLIDSNALEGFRGLGWTPEVITADVFDWLNGSSNTPADIVFANLFVHHFSTEELLPLLARIAACSQAFICCEPRRGTLPLLGSHLVGLIGANAVTRRDAVLSVHAGFRGQEVSALWPDQRNWHLREYPAYLFSHCFVATRVRE